MPRSPVEPLGDKRPFYTPTSEYTSVGGVTVGDQTGKAGAKVGENLKLEIFPKESVGGGYAPRAATKIRPVVQSIARAREIGTYLKRYLISLSVSENEEMTSQLKMTFTNPEFRFSKEKILGEGDHIVPYFGRGNDVFSNFNRFVLIRTHPHFNRDGIPTLEFVGRDGRFMMTGDSFLSKKRGARAGTQTQKKPPTSFTGTDSDIIDQIASFYGWAVDLDQTKGVKTRVRKKSTSMWEFVSAITKANNYTAWVDWSDYFDLWILHFRKKQEAPGPGRKFEYSSQTENSTLLEFHPTRDASRQVTDIEIVHFDRKTRYIDRQWLSYEDKSLPPPPPDTGFERDAQGRKIIDFSEKREYGASLIFKLEGRVIKTFADRPFKNKKQAKEYVTRLVNEHQSDFMTARGSVIGTENLRPRQIHDLSGIDEYSGFYYFTDVTHKIGSGGSIYENDFVGYRILDNTVTKLIRRGQLVSKWQGSQIIGEPPPPDLD
jgi:hypothetical protein